MFDLVGQRLGRVGEQQMGLVEEEDKFGLVEIASFRQLLEQFSKQPEQEGRVEGRGLDKLFGRKDVDDAATVFVDLHQVVDIEHRLAEEDVAALFLKRQQPALDRADRGRGDVAVFGGELLGVFADVLDHRAQVLEIEQQQALVVGDLEHQLQDAGLGVVQVEQAGEEQRTHVGNGRADRDATLAEDVPEGDRVGVGGKAFEAKILEARFQLRRDDTGGAHAGEIAFHISHEDRHAGKGKAFGYRLQRHRLAGAGSAGNQTMAVGHLREQGRVAIFGLGEIEGFGHECSPGIDRAGENDNTAAMPP